jgi:pimeloyl-ACP methyl ester carboxylesterase
VHHAAIGRAPGSTAEDQTAVITRGENMHRRLVILALALLITACATVHEHAVRVASVDHFFSVKSTAPGHVGQEARIYVREVAIVGAAASNAATNGVVLFVHGSGTPSEVAFDVPYKDYSWMAYLAKSGFDVFAMDMTGYGRSTRPAALNDPCNLSKEQQAAFVPATIPERCEPSFSTPITTMSSDWDDIDAIVDHLRKLRRVDKVSIIGWSQGGPRAMGYAARNPVKVSRLVVLAPAYSRASALEAPNPQPRINGSMISASLADFTANWEKQVGCPGQYEPAVLAAIWSDMLASDPVGATWKPAIRRAPNVPTWGFNQAVVARMQTPVLMVTGEHDKQVLPARVHQLYEDYGSKQKVLIDLACSSHNVMWEKNRAVLFEASRDWLRSGSVDGRSEGQMKLGS